MQPSELVVGHNNIGMFAKINVFAGDKQRIYPYTRILTEFNAFRRKNSFVVSYFVGRM